MATKVATVNAQKHSACTSAQGYAQAMGLGERIQDRLDAKGWSQAELARRIDVKSTTIWKLVTGQSQTTKHLRQIARELDTSEEFLLGETNDPGSNVVPLTPAKVSPSQSTVLIPQLKIGSSMANVPNLADCEQTGSIPLPRDWLEPRISGLLDQLFVAQFSGDTMSPTLLDGDFVIVDTAQQVIDQQDRIWCLSYGDIGMITRVRKQPDGSALILSDNPAVPPSTAKSGEIHVIGRVVWIGRSI